MSSYVFSVRIVTFLFTLLLDYTICLDTKVYDKVCTALKNTSLMNGIKKASPTAQTSCIEGFHSVINQYAPKMFAYGFQGMYCRFVTFVIKS